MSNKDIIAKIKAEIERRMDKHWEGLPNADAPEDDWTHNELCELGAYKELEHLETFLSTLESEKPVPNDLEEAANKFAVFYDQGTCDGIAQDCFRAGAEWQEEQDTREMIMSDGSYFQKCYELGKKDIKEQMMKEAVEAEILLTPYPTICLDDCKDYDFKDGQKVRIIIVKEDEE